MLSGKRKNESSLELEKLELFSLKLFKLCIEQLQKTHDREDVGVLVNIAKVCVDALIVCSGCSPKAPALSFEKILLHFAKWCLTMTDNLSHVELGLKVCRVLADRLSDLETARPKEKKSTEIVNLQKLIYDILWKAALQLEQKDGVARICLEMRSVALESLVLSGKFNPCSVFRSAMKVDLRYRKAINVGVSEAASSRYHKQMSASKSSKKFSYHKNDGASHSPLDTVNEALKFHLHLEQRCSLSSLIVPTLSCREFTVGVGYLLQQVSLYFKSSLHQNSGLELLSSTLDLCMQHEDCCSEEGHVIIQAQANCLQFWNAVRDEDGTE